VPLRRERRLQPREQVVERPAEPGELVVVLALL
jgi:hypothetical protein